jgi:hypothetical protein
VSALDPPILLRVDERICDAAKVDAGRPDWVCGGSHRPGSRRSALQLQRLATAANGRPPWLSS